MDPLVSIVITTCNRPVELRSALKSSIADEYPQKEILIVDDVSDNSLDFIKKEYDNVQILRTDARSGVGNARNLGIFNSRGKYITFLDDDDISYPSKLSVLTETAESTGAGFVFGRTVKKFVTENKSDVLIPESSFSYNEEIRWVPEHDFLLRMPTHNNGILVRRSDLVHAGGYAEDVFYFDDWAGWLKMFSIGTKSVFIPVDVAEFRYNNDGLSYQVNSRGDLNATLVNLYSHALKYFNNDWKSRSIILALLSDLQDITFKNYDEYVTHVLKYREKYFIRRVWSPSLKGYRGQSVHSKLDICADKILNEMVDPPEIAPAFNISLDSVGIVDQKIYLTIANHSGEKQLFAIIDAAIDLPAKFRGIHMSRIVREIDLLAKRVWLHPLDFIEHLNDSIIKQQHGSRCRIDMKIETPISLNLRESNRKFTQQFTFKCGKRASLFYLGVTVPHMTACPCVQCYSEYINKSCDSRVPEKITHSQRAESTVILKAVHKETLINFDLLALCDRSLTIVSDMLKREDEFDLVYHAHEKPQFIEDCVRDLAFRFSTHPEYSKIAKLIISSRSFESIHSRDISASVELIPEKESNDIK